MVKILQRWMKTVSSIILCLIYSFRYTVLLGGKVISSSTDTYLYRAYIETLLNFIKRNKGQKAWYGLVPQKYSRLF